MQRYQLKKCTRNNDIYKLLKKFKIYCKLACNVLSLSHKKTKILRPKTELMNK